MILSFEFSNFKSFKKTQYFSMKKKEIPGAEQKKRNNVWNDTVHVAAIYGANAAGKTSLLEALDALKCKATASKYRQYGDEYRFINSTKPISFKIDFITGEYNRKYCYEINYDSNEIKYEALLCFDSARPTTIFERSRSGIKRMSRKVSKEQKHAIPYFLKTEQNTSLLSFLGNAKKDANRAVSDALDFFKEKISVRTVADNETITRSMPELLQDDKMTQDWLNRLLPVADFGITQIDVVEKDKNTGFLTRQREILTKAVHDAVKVGNAKISDDELNKKIVQMFDKELMLSFSHLIDGKIVDFSSKQESRGTLAATNLFAQLIPTLYLGGVLVVDELDCSLHPMLVARIIEVFNDEDVNPRGAQLIFTTHDVSLLDKTIYGEEILARDEVWFVEKRQDNTSELYSLMSIKNTTRQGDNLYRKYVEGRYGATPKVSLSSQIESCWTEYGKR